MSKQNETEKWFWMAGWCNAQGLPPTQVAIWNQAELAWKNCNTSEKKVKKKVELVWVLNKYWSKHIFRVVTARTKTGLKQYMRSNYPDWQEVKATVGTEDLLFENPAAPDICFRAKLYQLID